MSNIYYEGKQLLSHNAVASKQEDKVRFHISLRDVQKILKLRISGVGLSAPVPFSSFSWRSEDIYYDHQDIGRVYIPKNIHLTNGQDDYFIVLIADELEIVRWPAYRVKTIDREENLKKELVTAEKDLEAITQSFTALVEHTGINKSFEERFADVKGVKIGKAAIVKLLEALFNSSSNAATLAETIYKAATEPMAFFIQRQAELESMDIEQPTNALYRIYLVHELSELKLVVAVDWKLSAEEINNAVSQLSNGAINEILEKEEIGEAWAVDELFKEANVQLSQRGLLLVDLNLDSDSYQLLLVPSAKFESLVESAKKCKILLRRAEEA